MRRQLYFLASPALALALAGCTAMPVSSAAPQVVLVTGGGLLQAISAQSLAPRSQLRLPGPVVAATVDPARHAWDLLTAGPQPAWQAVGAAGEHVRAALAGMQPAAMVFDPRTGMDLVVGAGAGGSGWLARINPATGNFGAYQRLPGDPLALALTPSGRMVLAEAHPSPRVLVQTPRGWQPVALAAPPRQLLVLPYGHKIFVLCAAKVAAIDSSIPGLLTYLPLGERPRQMLLKPDGGELYVSNAGGSVSIINTSTNEVSGTMPAGLGADAMAVTPDGSTLYVANAAAGTITVLSLGDRSVLALVHVGERPCALALDPAGLLLFASDAGSNDIAVLRTQDARSPNTLITLLPSPPQPGLLAVVPQ
ncbi:MAG: YncE family protein [Terriglobales bacterium]